VCVQYTSVCSASVSLLGLHSMRSGLYHILATRYRKGMSALRHSLLRLCNFKAPASAIFRMTRIVKQNISILWFGETKLSNGAGGQPANQPTQLEWQTGGETFQLDHIVRFCSQNCDQRFAMCPLFTANWRRKMAALMEADKILRKAVFSLRAQISPQINASSLNVRRITYRMTTQAMISGNL
jgi:hypothetical protein